MESSKRAGALPAEEEHEEGVGIVSGKLVAPTKLAHEWVGVSSITLPVYIRLVVMGVVL